MTTDRNDVNISVPADDPDVWVRRINSLRAVVREVAAIVAALAGVATLTFAYLNHETGQEVKQGQEVTHEKLDKSDAKIDKAAKAAGEVKDKLEKKEGMEP